MGAIGTVFLLQTGLLSYFSAPLPLHQAPENPPLQLSMVGNVEIDSLLAPTSIAFPGQNGFSKSALPTETRIEPVFPTNQSALTFLTPDPLRLGSGLQSFAPDETRSSVGFVSYSPEIFKGRATSPEIVSSGTRLEILQAEGRRTRTIPSLPSISGSTPLAPTLVEVSVNAFGFVTSERLIRTPGPINEVQKLANARATLLAKNIRFEPSPDDNDEFVTVRFHWHVQPE